MSTSSLHGRSGYQLSLRWKALIGLSLVLVLVNAALAWFVYSQLFDQFELQQQLVRERQSRQLMALLDNRYQQMSRLANVVPLLVPETADETLEEHLHRALQTNGVMLDLEWDIRSAHWVRLDGRTQLLWPPQAAPLPSALVGRIRAAPDDTARMLTCRRDCRQYLAAPLLWRGESSGALVLGSSVADALLAFNALSGAEAAIVPDAGKEAKADDPDTPYETFRAITHPERSKTLFESATERMRESESATVDVDVDGRTVALIPRGGDWFEVFRIADIAPNADALVMNNVTAQRIAIGNAIRNSILIGLVGLALSEGLLLLIMRTPLSRLRRLARLLPLLAEQRFAELRERLPTTNRPLAIRDEMDLIVEAVDAVSVRMEATEKDREEARTELLWLADHDPLTTLLNRRRFNQELVVLLDQSARDGSHGALLFVDLDQFKDVNDISGHPIGDSLLQRIAEQLTSSTKGNGVLGRLGGDEFAVILPGADAAQATALASKLQDRIQEVVVRARTWRHQVSASVGIVLYPQHGRDAQQLMADADLAMYQAKAKGRGRWHVFSLDDKGRERANARVIWADRIAAALSENRYELHFQPIAELATGNVRRAEALLRMRDPNGEIVLPFSFIPIAEETGQIEAIDHWVLSNAIELMASHRGLGLSINLSANALQDPALLPSVEELLQRHQVNPSDLTFEVTETVAINSLANATRLMRSIQEIGCRFALDDFGSGFASYAYLRQLPVNDVKIDGAFIRDIAYSREDRIFVRAVTDMAHGMGKRVIAEFVENEEIVDTLREIGVDYAQGYYIGRPAKPRKNPAGAARPPAALRPVRNSR
ncbi:MAG: EAL domain-containing protein [Thiohalocapsa sp.]|nr:EAL domain-containing protein [Thiohalocapsa sp.]